jgi:uncharacterized BrkB/YihY/UPF0761 family membrane protein
MAKTNKNMKQAMEAADKMLNETYDKKEKRFEKVVEHPEYLIILIMWLLHVVSMSLGIFFYFKQPDATWYYLVFGVPCVILFILLIMFIKFELEERKVYWREIE